MSAIRNTPIAKKFAGAFGLVCILCLTLGAYTTVTFRSIAAASTEVSENGFPSFIALSDLRRAINKLRIADLYLLLCQSSPCSAQENAMRQKALEAYQSALRAYEARISYPEERELHDRFVASFARYKSVSDRSAELLSGGKTGDALDVLTSESTVAVFDDTISVLNDDMALNVKHGLESSKATSSASWRAIWVTVLATLLNLGLCVLVGTLLNREITPRIRHVMELAQKLAVQDLTAHVRVTGTDELGQMGSSLNACVCLSISSLSAVLSHPRYFPRGTASENTELRPGCRRSAKRSGFPRTLRSSRSRLGRNSSIDVADGQDLPGGVATKAGQVIPFCVFLLSSHAWRRGRRPAAAHESGAPTGL